MCEESDALVRHLVRIRILNGRALLHSSSAGIADAAEAYRLTTGVCTALGRWAAKECGAVPIHATPGHVVMLAPDPGSLAAAMVEAHTWLERCGVQVGMDVSGPVQLDTTHWPGFRTAWLAVQTDALPADVKRTRFIAGTGTQLAELSAALDAEPPQGFGSMLRRSLRPSRELPLLWHGDLASIHSRLTDGLAWLRMDVVAFRRSMTTAVDSGKALLARGLALAGWFADEVPRLYEERAVAPGHQAVLLHSAGDDVIAVGARGTLTMIAEQVSAAYTARWGGSMRYALSAPGTEPNPAKLARSALEGLAGQP